jgi:hypothetical protein
VYRSQQRLLAPNTTISQQAVEASLNFYWQAVDIRKCIELAMSNPKLLQMYRVTTQAVVAAPHSKVYRSNENKRPTTTEHTQLLATTAAVLATAINTWPHFTSPAALHRGAASYARALVRCCTLLCIRAAC